MLDQPLDVLIKKKKKVDATKKKEAKVGGQTAPKNGKKLNKPESKGIVKPSKGVKTQQGTQKPKSGANPVARGGKGASRGTNTNTRGAASTRVNTATQTRGTTAPVRGGAAGRGATARGAKGTTRGGIRNNVMTQPRQDTRQTPRGGRAPVATKPVIKKSMWKEGISENNETPFVSDSSLLTKMSISIVNDQYQPQVQQQAAPQHSLFSQPQQHYQQPHSFTDEDDRSLVRVAANTKPIEFEEIDSTGTPKLKSLDAIFKSINGEK